MSSRLVTLLIVIAGFSALTLLALVEVGYVGIFGFALQTWAGTQVLVDLVIVAALAIIWMIRDARTQGISPWPYVAITLAAGSFGPLFYLVVREIRASSAAAADGAAKSMS